jgi:hypothetical protein
VCVEGSEFAGGGVCWAADNKQQRFRNATQGNNRGTNLISKHFSSANLGRKRFGGSGVLILSSCMQRDPGESAAFTIIYKPHHEINHKAI